MMGTQHDESPTLFIPERSRQEWGIALLLFVLSVVYLWPFLDFSALFIDEGIILQGAQRILKGEVPYRDFFSFYTPGSYYWLAVRFKLIGNSFLVARAPLAIYGGLFSLITYLLARRICGRWMAILSAYLFLVIGLPYMFVVLHNWDSSVLAYIALYAAVRFVETRAKGWAFATGTLAGLTCLFEQSRGAGLVLGLVLGFPLIACSPGLKGIFTRGNVAALTAGSAWPFVPTFVYFGFHNALTHMFGDWLWPLSHYSGANRVPYGYINIPFPNWEALYGSGSWIRRLGSALLTAPCFILPVLPFVAMGVLIVAGLRLRKQATVDAQVSCGVLASGVAVGLTISLVITERADFDHFVYISPWLLLILGCVLGGRVIQSRLLDQVRPLLTVILLFTFTAFGLILLLRGPMAATHRLETRRGVIRLPKADGVISYLQTHTKPGQTILVYPYQPIYYFLSATYSPTRFDYLQLGMHSSDQFQQAMSDLKRHPPEFVVWDLSFNTETIPNGWPTTPLEVLEKDPLRDFIITHYRPCATVSSIDFRYVILVRDDGTCPAGQSIRDHSP